MNQATIDRLDQCFADAPALLVGGPVPDVEIRQAETLLGVEFVSDYRWFVRTYGGAMVGSLPVYGLRAAEVMGTGETVVTETAHFRKDGWPSIADWIVISGDGYGNPIGMDKDGAVYRRAVHPRIPERSGADGRV